MNIYLITEEQINIIGSILGNGKYKNVYRGIEILKSLEVFTNPDSTDTAESK